MEHIKKNDQAKKAKKINILIACEESQAELIAFRELGCNAYSCDILPCRKGGFPQYHIQADVSPYLQGQTSFVTMDGKKHHVSCWHMIIAHPPCTYLCKVGSMHLYKDCNRYIYFEGKYKLVNRDRYDKMRKARDFFFKCLNAKAKYLAVENPIPMRLADLPKATCFACPSWFGEKYTKKTLYWLKNLPPLMAKIIHPSPKEFVRASRGKYRSRKFPAMAKALASQWLEYILNDNTTNQ